MTVHRKTFPVEIKTDGLPTGQVEAYVSMFGNVDLAGDRVMKGAFAASIGRWEASGAPVPVVFSHQWDDPWSHIGEVTALEETDQGLKATYTLDVTDNPLAAHIHRLMARRTLKEHSFAYGVVKERAGSDGANELHELDLIEIGPTLKGMNPDTELLAVKAVEEAARARPVGRADPVQLGEAVAAAVVEYFSTVTVETIEKGHEAGDVKPEEDEDATANDQELLSLTRQINQLRS